MLSIILPLFNKEKYIGLSLDSILKADIPLKYEIVVVDDASTDDSARIAMSYPVRLIRNDHNQGVSFTRNKGVYQSRGSIIAIIDSDIVIKKDTIKRALDIYDKDSNQVINAYWEEDGFNSGLFPSFLRIKQSQYMLRVHKGSDRFIHLSLGVFCLMKKSIFIESGGYNDKFTTPGGEEYEFAYRLSKRYPLSWYRDLTVYHNCRFFKEYFRDLYKRSMYLFYTINRAKKDKDYDLKNVQDFPEVFRMAAVFLFCLFCILGVFFNRFFLLVALVFLCAYLILSFGFFIYTAKRKSFIFALYCLFMDFLLYFPKGFGFLLGIWRFSIRKAL